MEYTIRDIVKELLAQRLILVRMLSEMNENLPNYSLKINDLSSEISNIDSSINQMLFLIKDVEIIGLQNELTIKTNTNEKPI